MLKRFVRSVVCGGALIASFVFPQPAAAQLDPLLFLKNTQPNVILAIDTSIRMQSDADENYYDPGLYTKTGAAYEAAMGLSGSEAQSKYRRKYRALQHLNPLLNMGDKYSTTRIDAVGDLETGYPTFFTPTRLSVARRGLAQAITENFNNARFGLVKTRQGSPLLLSAGNESPVRSTDPGQQSNGDSLSGKWKISRPTVTGANAVQISTGLVTSVLGLNANSTIRSTLEKEVGTAGALMPAGSDGLGLIDSPVGLLLEDALVHATMLITLDALAGGCRNTVVVLVVGGGEGTINAQDLTTKVISFLDITGRRVPVYVVAIAPPAADVASLRAVATGTGGQYFEVTKAMVDATTPGEVVPEVVRGVNTAIQHTFVPFTTFNTAPSASLPFGPSHESQVTSPIVGTVNLRGASKIGTNGSPEALPDSETYLVNGTTEVPQRSNVMVTTGFSLPGFEGQLRAFRVYKPIADSTRPSGYRFSQDGSRLWVSSTPAPGSRNIFTVLPGSTAMVPFNASQAAALDDYLGVNDPATLIDFVRQQPMGAIIGSTPAFLDPPSLDPPPDADYPGFREDNKDRRALILVGANDGMLHAIDARTGIEVWAFIPFNLLPKLRALRSGQSMDAFNYYVDSSPKIADVKVGAEWRTFVFFGQGPGGTFYNALDVTLENMSATVSPIATNNASLLSYFANETSITWSWSFPRNSSFDHTLAPYGELSATNASAVEKTIGETWSDPAVGQVYSEDGPYVVAVGSGFLKYSTQSTNRSGVTRSGTTFYVLDAGTGNVLGTPRDVGADSNAETIDDCRAANDCRRMKNALQMDPVATGVGDQRYITKVYIGDLDGTIWRFNLGMTGSTITVSTPVELYNVGADYPLFASMATVNVGNTNQYLFIGTGSDLLPSNGVNQSYSLLVLLDNGSSASKTSEILLERTDGAAGDEKVTSFPAVAGDIVFFSTTTHSPTTPCAPFSASLYAFTFIGGPAYDTNNDGKLTSSGSGGGKGKGGGGGGASADSTKVFSTTGARATAPFIVDQHLVFGAGDKIEMFGDPSDFNNGVGQAGVRILSWRVVK